MSTSVRRGRSAWLRRRGVGGCAVLMVVAAMLLAACSSKAGTASESSTSDGVKTGPGVTNSTITLGVLSVLSGAYASVGLPVLQGAQLYFNDLNQQGGVCGRTIKLDVQDDGLDVQTAVSDYTAMQPQVLGMAQLVGAAVNSALTQQVLSDQMFTFPSSNSSTLLNNPYYIIPGATYDIAFINAAAWLARTKGLAAGDTIAYVGTQGDTSGAKLGVEYAAKELGLKEVELSATPTATDLSSQASALKADKAKAIFVSTPPGQTLSLATAAASFGWDVPIIGTQSTFTPQELSAAGGKVLEQNFYVSTAIAPFSDSDAGPTKLRTEYTAKYKGAAVSQFIDYGYAGAGAYAAVLKQACADRNLTRAGLIKAFRETKTVDTDGVFPTLNFSQPGDPTTRESLIAKPDAAVAGGLTVVQPFTASSLATSYVAPEHGKGAA